LLPFRYYRFGAETFNFYHFNRQIPLMHFDCSHAGEIPPIDLTEANQTSFGAGTTVTMARWMVS
jgi:hypothetical protein